MPIEFDACEIMAQAEVRVLMFPTQVNVSKYSNYLIY